jgi:diguanylate cyclase (GGDEF)-like protein
MAVTQKLSLRRDGSPLPDQVRATDAQLTGSVHYLYDFVTRMLNLTPPQAELIRPGFDTLDLAIADRIEDWNLVFLHVLDELRQKGVELEQRDALVQRMRRDGRTLLYRREVGEERILMTLREEHRGHGFGIVLADHDRFKFYNDTHGHALGDLVLSTTGRLFRIHREGDLGVRWGGDEYLRIALNLATPTQLGFVAGRSAEIIAAFDWPALDERLGGQPPRLSIGLAYCECPSRDERDRMKKLDAHVDIAPDQRFDPAIPVPPGSSYDLARTLVGLADAELYQAKQSPSQSDEPRIGQVNVRIVNGRLIKT